MFTFNYVKKQLTDTHGCLGSETMYLNRSNSSHGCLGSESMYLNRYTWYREYVFNISNRYTWMNIGSYRVYLF